MRKLSVLFMLASLFFICCKKDKSEVEVDNETQSAIDNSIAEQEFMGVVPATNNHTIKTKNAAGGFKLSAIQATCDSLVKISGDTIYFTNPGQSTGPPTFTLAVNNATCNPFPEASGGRFRQGVVWVRLLKKIQTPSSTPNVIIKLLNYKSSFDINKPITYACDSILLTTVSNNSTTGERVFRVQIINGKCQAATWNTKYSTDRYIKIQTFADQNASNDIISIWGNSDGTNREGRTFNVTVDQATALIKHSDCPFISKGILNLTPSGFKTRIVDYSSGTNQDVCDDNATFTVNGTTLSFKLK